MRLNPQHAPLYGECLLTVQLYDEEVCWPKVEEEEEEEVQLYLLFSGSNQRHLTSVQRVTHVKLQAMCPAHDICEQVLVTLCSARPDGQVATLSQENFYFVPDLALDMAQFLLENTTPQDALLLDDRQVPLKECEKMDQNLALALRHLTLVQQQAAPGRQARAARPSHVHTEEPRVGLSEAAMWSDAPSEQENGLIPCPDQQRSTLLHFAASRGLGRVALFLLQQPGGRELLEQADEHGETPVSLARRKGHQHLVEVFSECDLWVESLDRLHICPEGRTFRHHPSLGTYTLTLPTRPERKGAGGREGEREGDYKERSLISRLHADIQELTKLVQLHGGRKNIFFSDLTPTPAPSCPPANHAPDSPAGGVWHCTSSQRVSAEADGLVPSTAEAPGSALPPEELCVVRGASCGAGSRHRVQEEEARGQDGGTSWHRVRKKGGRRRTTKTSAARRPGPQATSVAIETFAVVTRKGISRGPSTEKTPLPIKPASGLSVDKGGSGGESVAVVTTSAEKQEGEKSELCLGTRDTLTEKQKPSQTKTAVRTEGEATDACFFTSESARKEKAMGQGHSLDPEADRSTVYAPEHPHVQGSPRPQGPEEGKPRKLRWRDKAGSAVPTPSPEPGSPRNKAAPSQTTWYDATSAWADAGQQGGRRQRVQRRSADPPPVGPYPAGRDYSSDDDDVKPPASPLHQPLTAGPQPAPSAQSQEAAHGTRHERKQAAEGGRGGGGGEEEAKEGGPAEEADERDRDEAEAGAEEKGRKKRRKRRGRRGPAEAKLSPGAESPAPSEAQALQREEGGETAANTGSACESAPREETDESAMRLPSRAEDQRTDPRAHSPAPLKPPGFVQPGTSELSSLERPDLKEMPVEPLPADDTQLTALCQPSDCTRSVERAVPEDLVDLPPPHSEPTQLSAVACPQLNQELVVQSVELVGFNPPAEILESVRGSTASVPESADPADRARNELPSEPVASAAGFVQSVPLKEAPAAAERSESVAEDGRRSRGVAENVPLPPEQEGIARAPGGEYLERCLVVESPGDKLREEEDEDDDNGAGGLTEEVHRGGSGCNVAREQSPSRARECVNTGLNGSVAVETGFEETGDTENVMGSTGDERDGGNATADVDVETGRGAGEELAATAVALVTVAIASAVASVELSRLLKWRCAESPSEEQAGVLLLAKVNKDKVREMDVEAVDLRAEDSHTGLSKSLVAHLEPLAESTEPAEENNQLSVNSHSDPFTRLCSIDEDRPEFGDQSHTIACTVPVTDMDLVRDLPPQSSSKEQACPEQPPLMDPSPTKPMAAADNQQLSRPEKEPTKRAESPEKAETKAPAEANLNIITTHLHPDGWPPCPVIDTGQGGPTTTAAGPLDRQSKVGMAALSSPAEESVRDVLANPVRGQPRGSGSPETRSHPVDSLREAQTPESRETETAFTSSPKMEGQKGDLCPESREKEHGDVTREDEVTPPQCEIALPVALCDSPTTRTHSGTFRLHWLSEELPAVSFDGGESQTSPEMEPAAPSESGGGTAGREARVTPAPPENEEGTLRSPETDGIALDTVDGWKERERRKTKLSSEDWLETVTQRDTEARATEEDRSLREAASISDGTHTSEIQREKESFFPLQPLPEPCPPTTSITQATTCTDLCQDVHGDAGEECFSVCVLRTEASTGDEDRLTVDAELNDSDFKKPPEAVSLPEERERASCSSADDSSSLGPSSTSSLPSHGALSAGKGAMATGGSWKSKDGAAAAGVVVCGGGEEAEEEKEEKGEEDQPTESPVTSAIQRTSVRSLSPFRRHSWEPGRCSAIGESDVVPRSSLKSMEVKRAKPSLHRRSYSLEGLQGEHGAAPASGSGPGGASDREGRSAGRVARLDSQERGGGSLVSLTEEEPEGDGSSIDSQSSHRAISMTTNCPPIPPKQALTKSISMVTISHRETDVNGRPRTKRRISFSVSISPLFPKTRSFFTIDSSSSDEDLVAGRAGSFSSTSGSLEYSISEEEPGPLRSDSEKGGGTKVSRTFSYLRNKMSKKSKEKDKEKRGEKERESKDKEKRVLNGHLFSPSAPPPPTVCQQCNKPLHSKEAFVCSNCGVYVHKSCRESLPACAKAKVKQSVLPEVTPGAAVTMRTKSTYLASSVSSLSRDRWSTLPSSEDHGGLAFVRRNPVSFNTHSNLSKSISTSNIAGMDDGSLKTFRCLSQSTDNLHQSSKVNASTESLTDEGTEMMDSQLLGEFDCDVKDLEADSWSATVDKKFLKLHKKDEVKRQDVIYELLQTEFHHVRTLRIMSEVYYKGIQKELQLDTQTLDKVFPVLEDLLDTHTHFFTLLLERKRASLAEGRNGNSFLIRCIGDVLVNQFSGCCAERMKKVYGKFCSRHNEAVNHYKELHARDKRFQATIKRLMSSSIVRRLSIPECILLVTQRITKYPVLIQRILQHTKDTEEDHIHVSNALRHVKELIAAVDSKVNEQEKKKRLKEVYSRTDSKSIMRMKSGQMFAKEDLIRGRKLLHEGAVQLKNNSGRLKDVHAMLLSDVLVFLQEKDQKYVFAFLDQRSTVISLQKLIVREVANEERGLFLISAAWTQMPEMVEVLANSKDERNTWLTIIQNATKCMEKDEDEGVPSESEEDRRQQENRAKEIRELLKKKDEQIISLLEEKVLIFRDMCDFSPSADDSNPPIRERMLFRATPDEVTKGEPIMKDALKEVETLHVLVNSNVGGAACSTSVAQAGGGVGPVCLPRRAETFGGFDSHQMNSNKNGEKDESDDAIDLRRTESDSVLKKGATTSLQMLLKRNNEQVQHSVTNLHDLLTSLQAVVVQQDSYIEDQRQVLSDRPHTNPSSRHSSSSSLSSSSSSRPSSLIEQEKQRSLERQRQEAASLQKQQAAHQEERRRREKEWDVREQMLAEQEEKLTTKEEEAAMRRKELEQDREELQRRKEEYQRDLERLREAQRRLERDKEALRKETERLEAIRKESSNLQRYQRNSSTASEDSLRFHSSGSLELEPPRDAPEQPKEVELSSSAPSKEPFLRIGSKRMGKTFNPFSSSKAQGGDKESQLPARLLQIGKSKEKKEKKKRKGKGEQENPATVMSEPQSDEIFFC